MLNKVADIARIGGWEMDLEKDGKATWTQGTYDIVEIEPGDPVPGFSEHIFWYLPEYREMITRKMNDLVTTKKPMQFEAILKTKKGNLKWCHAFGEVVEKDGKVVKLRGVFQDITERKQAEAKLIETERKLSFHLQNTPVAAVEWDLYFKVSDWNEAAEKIFGYTKSEAMGRHAAGFLVPESAREHVDKVWSGLLKNKSGYQSTNENYTKEGKSIICDWYNTPLVDYAGQVYGVVSLVQDITERKKIEEALRESEERYRVTIDSIKEGLYDWDIKSNQIYYSDSY